MVPGFEETGLMRNLRVGDGIQWVETVPSRSNYREERTFLGMLKLKVEERWEFAKVQPETLVQKNFT